MRDEGRLDDLEVLLFRRPADAVNVYLVNPIQQPTRPIEARIAECFTRNAVLAPAPIEQVPCTGTTRCAPGRRGLSGSFIVGFRFAFAIAGGFVADHAAFAGFRNTTVFLGLEALAAHQWTHASLLLLDPIERAERGNLDVEAGLLAIACAD